MRRSETGELRHASIRQERKRRALHPNIHRSGNPTFLRKVIEPRIITHQRQFRKIEKLTDALRTQDSHAFEGFECAVLVAETTVDKGLFIRVA